MTMPTLIGKYRKQETIAKLQKVYSTLNQALKRSEVDNGDKKYWPRGFDIGNKNYFNTYWAPYLKVVKVCKTYKDCGYNRSGPWTYLNGTECPTSVAVPAERTTIYLPDGILAVFLTSTIDGENGELVPVEYIIIDLNGGRGPNTFGIDTFYFVIVDNNLAKGIMPHGYNQPQDLINTSCSSNGDGSYCVAKIMHDGWKITEDYPFK